MKPRTVLMTGGHVTPAVALGQALTRRDPSVRLVYLGRSFASEHTEVERVGMEFVPFESGKIHRYVTVTQLLELPKLITGFVHAWRLLQTMRPQVVVGFGGYLSVPIVLVAKLRTIPIVIHEQTTAWGAAHRLLKPLATARAVSWPHLVEPGAILTGNPIPAEIRDVKVNPHKSTNRPVLFILGGSQGSRTIDDAIEPLLPTLVKRFEIYHQTRRDRRLMTASFYHSAPWFSTPKLAKILAETSLVIARSGANTVTYLAFLGIPAILVPLPISGSQEQQKNAQLLARVGLAVVMRQESLTPETLSSAIDHVASTDHREAQKKARTLVFPDAADRLADIVTQFIHP